MEIMTGKRLLQVVLMVVVPVVAYGVPTASNQSLGKLGPGKEILFSLSYGGSPTNFVIVSNPAHGTLRRYSTTSYPQYYYYKANTNYEGADSFTWKCRDASGDSGVATCSVTISAIPTANNQAATVVIGGEAGISLSYSDPVGDRTKTFAILSGPAHGTLQTYKEKYGTDYPGYYFFRPAGGYVGADSFVWKVNNGYADSAAATVTITVKANTAPVANNYSASINSGTRGSVYLYVTHADSGQTMTYTLVSGPGHGTVEMPVPSTANGAYAYYTSSKGYVGADSFTWRVSDGFATSGTATATITVNAAAPVPQDQSACLPKDTPAVIDANYSGGGGYTCAVTKVTNPSHGTVAVTNNTSFRYVPAAGYTGADSFTWKVNYGVSSLTGASETVTCSIFVKDGAMSNDWPQWRCDEYRSATTLMSLPSQLYLQWRHDYRATKAARNSYSRLERCNWAVVAGKTMFAALGISDCVVALDTETGTEKWRFYANGPVRGAPAAFKSGTNTVSVFFGSDDGWMYCLDGVSGQLRWKKRGGPSGRLLFWNDRLTSPWMVRNSGPLIADNRVVFVAGYWAMEGVFGYGLDVATGAEIWKNDSLTWCDDELRSPNGPKWARYARGGMTPVGWLTLSPDRQSIYIAGGKEGKGSLSAVTGRLQSYQLHDYMMLFSQYLGGNVEFATGMEQDYADEPTPVPMVVSGTRVFTQTDAAGLGVVGTVGDLLAADGKLFAVTTQGSIYCFGTQAVETATYPVLNAPLSGGTDQWTSLIQHVLAVTGADDGGAAVVLGSGSGRLVDELLLKSVKLQVIVVEPDTNKASVLRNRFEAAGLYGGRVAVMATATDAFDMPANAARLILAEDSSVAGLGGGASFVKRVFDWARPYGGAVWLTTTAQEHESLVSITAASGLYSANVRRDGNFSVLEKIGPPRVEDFHGPMGVQWFGDSFHQRIPGSPRPPESFGGIVDDHVGSADLYTGLMTLTSVTGKYEGTGHGGAGFLSGMVTNPFTGILESRLAYVASSTCQGSFIKDNWVLRLGAEMFWYDPVINSGGVYWPEVRNSCLGGEAAAASPGAIGNGILCAQSDAYLGLAPKPDVENWAFWGEGPSRQVVDELPIKRIGLNFGAPGDRLADDGTLWLEYPLRDTAGLSPNVHLSTKGTMTRNYHHSSRLPNDAKKWVDASNVTGLTNLTLALSQPAVALAAVQAPLVDGALTDACWDGRRPVMLSDGSMAPGFAWMRYDSTNVYFAMQNKGKGDFHVYLSNREMASTDPHSNHGAGFDGVSLYVHFTLSQTGALSQVLGNSICGGSETGTLNAAWSGAVATGAMFSAEVGIPWSTLEAAGLRRDDLIVNLYGPGTKRLRDLISGRDYMAPTLPGAACRQFCPLYFDAPKGDLAHPLTCTVRLHFAETEGALAGQRVFDVKLQGQTVLSGFDIYQEALSTGSGQAGGADRAVVKEFQNVLVNDNLVLELVPKVGSTLISGVEVIGSVPRVNQAPLPVIDATPVSGEAPLAVLLSARRSSDPDGQIANYKWVWGGGQEVVSGVSVLTNVFNDSDVVQLLVTDNDGATSIANVTITVAGGTPEDFVCKIRASGGDFNTLSGWHSAIVSSLTNSGSRLYSVTDRGTYATNDNGRAVVFSGGGTGVLKHVSMDGVAYVVGCGGVIGTGAVTCSSGHTFVIGSTGKQIRNAVVECYNDWPTGLRDAVNITGWTSSPDHYVKVVVPAAQRHKGRLFNSDGVTYSGFTLVNATFSGYSLGLSQPYTRAEGVAIHGLTGTVRRVGGVYMVNGTWCDKGLICNAGYDPYHDGVASIKCGSENYIMNTIVMNSRGGDGIDSAYGAARILNVTVVNGQGVGIRGGRTSTIMRNVISSGNAGGDYFYNDPAVQGWPDMGYCASSDGTATGTASRVSQTFRFVSAVSNDYHLATDDTCARGCGTSLSDYVPPVITDIDGEFRTGIYDIGADQVASSGTVDSDGDGIPDDWEIANGLNPHVSNATTDSDGDGVSDLAEYIAGTRPAGVGATESRFEISACRMLATGGYSFWFQGKAGRTYTVAFKDNLMDGNWQVLEQRTCLVDEIVTINDSTVRTSRCYRVTVSLQ
ncbi:MAG: hypothetical protein C0404_01695 [Verrucomicrobia bacterium]|nr:hypothetical protein [Verrucomicrobiota bacterium]